MLSKINERNWWIVIVAAAILSIAVTLVQQTWLPDNDLAAFLLVVVILGIGFYWIYLVDKEKLWWALIPALAMAALLATGVVAYFTPKDASGSSPYGVVTLGVGAAIMGYVLNRTGAKQVLYAIAAITLLVGILMLPVNLIWKIIFIVAEVLVIGFLAWQTTRQSS